MMEEFKAVSLTWDKPVLCQYVNMIVVETNSCCHQYTSGTSLATDGGAVNREATEINAISGRVWALNNTPGWVVCMYICLGSQQYTCPSISDLSRDVT